MRIFAFIAAVAAAQFCPAVAAPFSQAVDAGPGGTVLGIQDTRFTVNGRPVFLLGFSYYGALGASEDFMRKDLDDLQRRGFNWLRVWATWTSGESDISAVDAKGQAREPFLGRLKWLVRECDRRGLIVDITLNRGKPRLPDFAAHQQAIVTLVTALKPYRNWYLDLGNERDVRDDRYVPASELKTLRARVRRLDPQRLVTASFGGHDLSRDDIREAMMAVGVDFLCPHRPRGSDSPSRTDAHTRSCLAIMKELGRAVPLHYQEPFRRGYVDWQPTAADFLTDLKGAVNGGAAGWCFHNGQQRDTPDHQPRRSFDMRDRRLFEQLDREELEFVNKVKAQGMTPRAAQRPGAPAAEPALPR